jgi:arylsulfatase A-like enzyme
LCLLAGSIGAAQAAASAAAERPARPNVLVLLADDLGYEDIGVHGSREIPTPNIDSIAREGVRCTSGYVTAPRCAPSRAALFTGRYQQRLGCELDAERGLPPGEDARRRLSARGMSRV